MLCNRTINVQDINLDAISSASIFRVGDSDVIRPRNRVFALQREIAFFLPDEGGFSNYPMFTQPIPQPSLYNPVQLCIHNENQGIEVGWINITAVAAASIAQMGNSRVIDSESRVINIRQLLRGERPVGPPRDTAGRIESK